MSKCIICNEQPAFIDGESCRWESCEKMFDELTPAQLKALKQLHAQGGHLAAGYNVFGGHSFTVNARVLDALVKKDIVRPCYSSEGGYAVELF